MFTTKFTKPKIGTNRAPGMSMKFAAGGLVGPKRKTDKTVTSKGLPSDNFSNATEGPIRKKSNYAGKSSNISK